MRTSPASGLGAWLLQRFTALYLLFFLLFALGYFAFFPPASYEEWRASVSGTAVVVASGMFVIALLVHAWVGLRDVILDYVKPLALRVAVLVLLAFCLAGMAAWMARALFAAGA